MSCNTLKAEKLLNEGSYTLVLCNKTDTVTADERGVRPLIRLLENGGDYSSFSAADKVVGSAAAYLYVLLKIKEVYALTLSEKARSVFERYGIEYYCDKTVPYIINRSRDGTCPMERAVENAVSPEDALVRIREALKALG